MSSYLWMRKWKILVVDAQDKEALNVSDLHVKFTVKKSREINNYSTVEIYNLTAATEQKILKEGDRIIIEAGYEGYLTVEYEGSEDCIAGVSRGLSNLKGILKELDW